MNQDIPVGLIFPPNGRSKCTERLDAPIGCVQAFLRCRRLQRRNREKYVKKGYLLFLGLTSTIPRIPSSAGRNPHCTPGLTAADRSLFRYANYRVGTGNDHQPRPLPIRSKDTRDHKIAAEYSNIGINKIDSMLKQPNCPFVLYVGTRKLVKRKEFEEYISGRLVI